MWIMSHFAKWCPASLKSLDSEAVWLKRWYATFGSAPSICSSVDCLRSS